MCPMFYARASSPRFAVAGRASEKQATFWRDFRVAAICQIPTELKAGVKSPGARMSAHARGPSIDT